MTGELLVVVPARGGSKRIPRKNILPLLGQPLLLYTLNAAREAGLGPATWVSTDDAEIAAVTRAAGMQVLPRQQANAQDRSSTESVLLEALDFVAEKHGWQPELVLTLPPTSPLRRATTIAAFVQRFRELPGHYDAMHTLTETRDDLWLWDGEPAIRRLFPDAPRRRQERQPVFVENSCMYITRVSVLRACGFILGKRAAGFPIEAVEGVDINEPEDLAWVEFLLRQRAQERPA